MTLSHPEPPDESSWLSAYDYELPDAQIARRPAEPRDASRLLVLDRGSGARTQTTFRHLPRFLREGDLLVLNETRVLRARFYTRLERTGRPVEVLLSHAEGMEWLALLGSGRRVRAGDRLVPEDDPAGPGERLEIVGRDEGGLFRLRVLEGSMGELLERIGHVPLPPYIDRPDRPEDREWYQTVFARQEGAVAAPTAGLHFTPHLLSTLESLGVELARIVLHVGPGTFLPVRARAEADHRVLPERYEIRAEAAAAMTRARAAGRRIVAVGTTTVRALETAAMKGRKDGGPPSATTPGPILSAGSGWTDLTVVPGYRFQAVDALLTNFHLPRSSLLLLVAAFAGRETILEAYREARDAGFRFYSFGDAMLIV